MLSVCDERVASFDEILQFFCLILICGWRFSSFGLYHVQGEGISQFLEEFAEFAPLLKLDEEDDATSSLKEHTAPKPEGFAQSLCPPEWTSEHFSQSPFNGNFSCGIEVS